MRRARYQRNHTQTIINFYAFVTIIIMSAVIVVYSKYLAPRLSKNQQLSPCINEFKINQNIRDRNGVKTASSFFRQGNYKLDGGAILLDNSNLNEINLIKQIDKLFEENSLTVSVVNEQKFLNIKYEIIEKQNSNEVDFLVSFRISGIETSRFDAKLNLDNQAENSRKISCIMQAALQK